MSVEKSVFDQESAGPPALDHSRFPAWTFLVVGVATWLTAVWIALLICIVAAVLRSMVG